MKKLLAILCTVAILFGSVFTGVVVSAATDSVTYITPSSYPNYQLGTGVDANIDTDMGYNPSGNITFTAKATLGSNGGFFRLAGCHDWSGYGYFIGSDGEVCFQWNNSGTIGDSVYSEVNYAGKTFKLQVKITLVDSEGDGSVNDSKYELYFDNVLIRTDYANNYTANVGRLCATFMAFDMNVDLSDAAITYITPDTFHYTLGSGIDGGVDAAIEDIAAFTGNFVFTAKVTTNANSYSLFRVGGSDWEGHDYRFVDNTIVLLKNGGGTAINTYTFDEGFVGKTFKVQYKATMADIDGDGFDDGKYELYIDDELVCSDAVKDFTPRAGRLIATNMSFDNNIDLSDEDYIRLEPSDFPNYKQGTAGNIDTTIGVEKVSKNINFVAKVTTTEDTTPEFRLAGHDWNGYGYRFTDSAILFQKNNSGSITSYPVEESYIGKTFKLQMKVTAIDTDGDGLDDAKIELIIDGTLIGTDYVNNFNRIGRLCAKNMAFSNNIDFNGEAVTYLTPEIFHYTLGTGVGSSIDAPRVNETVGNFVFTAKATLGAEGVAMFRIGGLNDWLGHDFRFNGNNIEMLQNGGGTVITTYTADESFAGKTVKVQYKALVVDRDDDGFDDTLYELYVDDVLVISKVVIDYTAKAGRLIATNMSFDKNVDISAADTMYLKPGSYNYTQGTGVDGSIDAQRVQNASGNIVFTAKATINADGGKFRIAGTTDWAGHGYAFGSDTILFQKDGGGAAINTYPIASNYNGKTVVLKYVATVVDVDGDGLDDTWYQLYIDDELVCSDYVNDYAQYTGRLCASKMSFEDYIAVLDEDAINIAPSNFPNYAQGTVGVDTNLTSNKVGNYVFTANATIPEGSYGNFRLANQNDWLGYGYRFLDGAIRFEADGGNLIKEYATGVNYIGTTFKLQMKLTVVDVEGDGFDDIHCELYVNNELVCSDYIKDKTQLVGKLCATNMSFVDYIAVLDEDAINIAPSNFPNYAQGTVGADTNLTTNKVGNYVFTANATIPEGSYGNFRLANQNDWLGYGYRFLDGAIRFEADGGNLIKEYNTGVNYIGTTFKLQMKLTVVDVEGDGFDDIHCELYVNNELVCSDYIKDKTQLVGKLCATNMSFVDYAPLTAQITEVAPSTLYIAGSAINRDWTNLPLYGQTDNISITAAVKTGASGVVLKFIDKDFLGYGFKFYDNKVDFCQTDTVVKSFESANGTFLNTVFKMQIVITLLDTNMDDAFDATNYKLYIDDELAIDATATDYVPSEANVLYCGIGRMDLYDLYALSGSDKFDVADANDTKLSLSDFGLLLGKHYGREGLTPDGYDIRTNYGAEYEGSVLNTVLEAKVMLENGGIFKYPASKTLETGLQIKVSGSDLLIQEAGFDINGDGEENGVLATVTSADIGGAIIPATPFDLKIHINTSCDGGELYNALTDEVEGTVDNVVTITYYINETNVYSISLTGDVYYDCDEETGSVLEDSIVIEGGPSLLEGRNLMWVDRGEFNDVNSLPELTTKTPADFAGYMNYGKYEADRANLAWTLGLNECFNTDVLAESVMGHMIHNSIGSLRMLDDGSLAYQVFIDNSGKVYRLTPAGESYVGKQFNYKMTVQNVDHDGQGVPNDLAIGVWIDGKLANNEYIYVDNSVRKVTGNYFTIFGGVELIAPAVEEVESDTPSYEDYVVVTGKDFANFEEGTYTSTVANQYLFANYKYNDSFNGKVLKLKVKYNQASGLIFDIGNTGSYSLRFIANSENGGYAEQWVGDIVGGSRALSLPNLTPNAVHDLAVAIDYIDGNVRFRIWIDDVYQGELFAGNAGNNVQILTAIGVFATEAGQSIQFGDDVVPVLQPMEAGDYTIEYAAGTTYTLNGEAIEVTENGYVIAADDLGVHTLEMIRGAYSASKVIVIYMENDLNADYGVDVLDFIAMMKNTAEESFSNYVAMAAAGKTSLTDVCKPSDLVAMKKVLLGIA